MTLVALWFILIALLWTGFFVLEGFDFGVGALHAVLGRDEPGRQAVIATIGPVWDANEVWLVVAAAAMFAAFPGWYATMFSGLYLALAALLIGLILRGVSFEFRGRMRHPRWRRVWDGLLTGASLGVPWLIGIALGDLLVGLPIGRDQEYTGSFGDLFTAYGVFVGVTLVLLSLLHGSTFLALKTTGAPRSAAARSARRIAPVTTLAVLAFAWWTQAVADRGTLPNLLAVAAVGSVAAAAWLAADHRDGWAFTATTVAMAASVLSMFVALYPRVMVSSTDPAFDLTVHNSASGSYALKVITVVAVVLLPVVLAYQGWTYHVFRQRVGAPAAGAPATGAAAAEAAGAVPAPPAPRA